MKFIFERWIWLATSGKSNWTREDKFHIFPSVHILYYSAYFINTTKSVATIYPNEQVMIRKPHLKAKLQISQDNK